MNMEESNNGSKKLQIRNSTAEFLIFQIENKEEGIEVLYQDETLWLTQKTMSILFDVDIRTINEHLKNIYSQGEVDKNTTIRKNRIVQKEGNRNISREVFIYSLDAIISVGYRVNSVRATQFRQWCTFILRQFAIRGYVIDKKRMENGSFINEDYFEHLLAEIREIRLSERRFYQKLTDIYATSIDYNLNAPTTRLFFKKVRCSIYTPLIIRIFLLNRYNLCFDKYTECRDNANRCISQLCIYVLYRLLSVLLWNVRYQIQRVER